MKQRGEDRYNAKLTIASVVQMRKLRQNGMCFKDIASQFGISASNASNVCRGLYWKDAGGPLTRRKVSK